MSGIRSISVVIPTANRPRDLERALSALSRCRQQAIEQHPELSVEVVVSNDGAMAEIDHLAARFQFAQIIQGPQRGPAANRNHGARRTTGEWLLFTDDDCEPALGWMTAYLTAMVSADSKCVLEGRTVSEKTPIHLFEFSPENLKGGYLWSCNFAIRNADFQQVGGFDENFPYPHMEDVDLRERLLDQGRVIQFVPEAEVFHPRRISFPSFKEARKVMSEVYYYGKHQEPLSIGKILHSKLGYFRKRWRGHGNFYERICFLYGCAMELCGTFIYFHRRAPSSTGSILEDIHNQ